MNTEITKFLHKSHLDILIVLVFLISFLVAGVAIFNSAYGAPITGFKAGSIIDDEVFTNKSTMNTSQIQSFLNAKVPVCDTWHAPGYGQNPPFTCLKDYSENGRSAAQIIYDTAQQYRINPQVFIVLLQKEQGLVTDTWPLDKQYRSATGYGCPDTAPCDSQYYGLTNQLNWSGKMFRSIMDNSPNWYTPYVVGNNYVRWSPNSSCGGTNVNIENRATQALYNYTPYQPNQAALNAGYGTGDGCSAYGNRNFYLYFTDWFGSTRYKFGNVPSNQSVYSKTPCSIRYFAVNAVGRLYNPDTRDFLFTRDYNEACRAISLGYIWDDVVMLNATGDNTIPIYRVGSPQRHIFTSSAAVRDDAINNYGYVDEGIGYYAYGSTGPTRTPVYGVQLGDTFFTTSSGKEAEMYRDSYGYHYYGVLFYTDKLTSAQQLDLTRLERTNQRLYTPHQFEKDSAVSYGFKYEGSVSSVDIAPNEGNLPVYRTRGQDGVYAYTTNRVERDLAVINYHHTAEGTPFYGLMWSSTPVYGAWNQNSGFRIYASNQNEYDNAVHNYSYIPSGIAWYSY